MRVLLIGDIIIDRNIFTKSNRNCPENKNIPVCHVNNEEYLLGGCANIAVNLCNLDHDVFLFSYVGNDYKKKIIFNKLDEKNINKEYIIIVKDRPTITKNRIFLDNKLICRYDEEDNSDINYSYFKDKIKLIDKINFDMIVISDYAKGIINNTGLCKYVIEYGNSKNIPIFIDPKPKNIINYKNSTLIKANFDEISNIYFNLTGKTTNLTESDLLKVSKIICEKYNIKYLITSLASNGIFFYKLSNNYCKLFSKKYVKNHEVVDVTGCGDLVLSILVHYQSDISYGCDLANKIAQESVKYIGVQYITKEKIKKFHT